ncbi:amidohydrolase [Streptomyces sp. WMMB303]|uniref:amidohydrolase n=1 Tax=Streptomyces sp. WMMB303 TaxID=3034154 RepID=UPI0023ED4ED3|nr:amidohydrolase [Streptomyces sp. WMMB303]MDF4249292.1 amidohydrolase [Streptomyces sp. WMMB303]
MTEKDPTTVAADAVLTGLPDIRDSLEFRYKDLHQHPELGFQERRTAGHAAQALNECDYEVTEGIGGTGVLGVLHNGAGPTVLLRADMDALPVREQTGLPYASTDTARGPDGAEQPVMHACGHDVHVICLLGAARLMAAGTDAWRGTLVVLFQPNEENGSGARAMIDDGLARRIPRPDVALGQHVLPAPAGTLLTRPGVMMAASDSLRVTFRGRGAHGSMPERAVDPVVLAASTVLRLQTVVARETAATTPAVVTVGAIHAGSGPNIIPDRAEIQLNIRTFGEETRARVLAAVRRIIAGECAASGAEAAEFETIGAFSVTENDVEATERVASAFGGYFGERARTTGPLSASEDFGELPAGLGCPATYWGLGGTDPAAYRKAERAGTVDQDIPGNHSPRFAPVVQPTLDTGVRALVTAALAWLAPRPKPD